MKKLLIALFILFAPATVLATAQLPDILLHDGNALDIFTTPLESAFSASTPRPNKLFQPTCTANWRGYVATWRIIDNELYLVKVIEGSCDRNAPEIPLSRIIPNARPPLKAAWYSGTLRAQLGRVLEYVHAGFATVYEEELRFEIDRGKLIKTTRIDNRREK